MGVHSLGKVIWQFLDKDSVKGKDLEVRLPGLKSLIHH